MPLILDNPASRLYQILRNGQGRPRDELARTSFSVILQVSPDNYPALMTRLSEVITLPGIIKEQMLAHYPDENAPTMHWTSQVEGAFSNLNLNSAWLHFITTIDDHSFNYLGSAAKFLQFTTTHKPISTETLSEMRDKVDATLKEVLESDIEAALKITITRHLRGIVIAIDEHFIAGSSPILDSVNAACGAVVTDVAYREFMETPGLGQKVASTLSSVASVVTIVDSIPPLKALISAGWKALGGS